MGRDHLQKKLQHGKFKYRNNDTLVITFVKPGPIHILEVAAQEGIVNLISREPLAVAEEVSAKEAKEESAVGAGGRGGTDRGIHG